MSRREHTLVEEGPAQYWASPWRRAVRTGVIVIFVFISLPAFILLAPARPTDAQRSEARMTSQEIVNLLTSDGRLRTVSQKVSLEDLLAQLPEVEAARLRKQCKWLHFAPADFVVIAEGGEQILIVVEGSFFGNRPTILLAYDGADFRTESYSQWYE